MHVIPYLLQDILIVIAFFWKPMRLPQLKWQIDGFMKFTSFSNITIVIMTNEAANLKAACDHYYSLDCSKVEIWDSVLVKENPFDLTYEHRLVFEEKIKTKNYTSYMYNEDDHLITPQGLVSWAIDTELLEPLGFTRGFLRSEFCGEGTKHLMDYFEAPADISLTRGRRKLNRSYKTKSNITFESKLQLVTTKYSTELCPSTDKNGSDVYTPCPIHTHFFSPEWPYQGMWLLSHTQLQSFMNHKLWNITYTKTYKNRKHGRHLNSWKLRERAASYNILINTPPSFQHNKVVPFYHIHDKNVLSGLATIHHLSNNYCTKYRNRDRSYIYDSNHIYIVNKEEESKYIYDGNSAYYKG